MCTNDVIVASSCIGILSCLQTLCIYFISCCMVEHSPFRGKSDHSVAIFGTPPGSYVRNARPHAYCDWGLTGEIPKCKKLFSNSHRNISATKSHLNYPINVVLCPNIVKNGMFQLHSRTLTISVGCIYAAVVMQWLNQLAIAITVFLDCLNTFLEIVPLFCETLNTNPHLLTQFSKRPVSRSKWSSPLKTTPSCWKSKLCS